MRAILACGYTICTQTNLHILLAYWLICSQLDCGVCFPDIQNGAQPFCSNPLRSQCYKLPCLSSRAIPLNCEARLTEYNSWCPEAGTGNIHLAFSPKVYNQILPFQSFYITGIHRTMSKVIRQKLLTSATMTASAGYSHSLNIAYGQAWVCKKDLVTPIKSGTISRWMNWR